MNYETAERALQIFIHTILGVLVLGSLAIALLLIAASTQVGR